MRKPAAIVGRDRQWRTMERFLLDSIPRIALFSATGFTPDLVEAAGSRPDTVLVDLKRLYGLS
ncbi:hypothetical protein [Nonomuraea sp. NPDC049028]|uniref:hypothetical protein n=1 Tax=Nonomuraea sp. NPDC049028 TaxID=3364348 RepID=UPI00371A5148